MYELGAAEAARRIRAGTLSPSNLLAACLKRTDAVEAAVAWCERVIGFAGGPPL